MKGLIEIRAESAAQLNVVLYELKADELGTVVGELSATVVHVRAHDGECEDAIEDLLQDSEGIDYSLI
jgi:hypothetical protein